MASNNKRPDKKIRVGVIFGGQSKEHEVSLNSARGVIDALDKKKYESVPIAITKKGKWLIGGKGARYLSLHGGVTKEDGITVQQSQSLVATGGQDKGLSNFTEDDTGGAPMDIVLPLGHGTYAEDGKLQGMLEMLGVPYVFSNTLSSALAMNKPKSQIIAQSAGLDILPHSVLRRGEKQDLKKIAARLGLPIVVKPAEAGSSVGVSIARTISELKKGVEGAFIHGDCVLLEKYQKGRELTVGVMGNDPPKALPVIEIIPRVSNFYDYKAKYEDGGSKHVCPAALPRNIKIRTQNAALKAYRAFECRDLARADFIWDGKKDKIYFLEINTIPGMTSTSLVPEAAKAAGLEFGDFLDKLIEAAIGRNNK